jgi:hypothetical protein
MRDSVDFLLLLVVVVVVVGLFNYLYVPKL